MKKLTALVLTSFALVAKAQTTNIVVTCTLFTTSGQINLFSLPAFNGDSRFFRSSTTNNVLNLTTTLLSANNPTSPFLPIWTNQSTFLGGAYSTSLSITNYLSAADCNCDCLITEFIPNPPPEPFTVICHNEVIGEG